MWKLFYHDRSTFSSRDGSWDEAPALGVMGVVHVDDTVGWSRDSGDFYILPSWMNDQPIACDHWGLMDYLIQVGELDRDESLTSKSEEQLESAGVKFGRSIPNDEWRRVIKWMDEDPELPRKSARYRYERP